MTATVIIAIGLVVSIVMPETNVPEPAVPPSTVDEENQEHQEKQDISVFLKLRRLLGDPTRLKLFLMFLLNSMNNASCFVIWVLVSQEKVHNGGFGFDSLKTGIMFAIYGFFAVGFQLFFFKNVMTRFNLLTTFRIGSIFQMLQNAMFGIMMLINAALVNNAAQPYVLWLCLTIFCLLTAMGFMMTLNVLQSMIVNATDRAYQGLVQGVSESIATAARALGPIIFGFSFSFFLKHIATPLPVFAMLVGLYGTSLFISVFLDREIVNNPD
jgi:MFS family permease